MFMDIIKFKSVASFSENHKTFYSFACKKKKINEIRGGNQFTISLDEKHSLENS